MNNIKLIKLKSFIKILIPIIYGLIAIIAFYLESDLILVLTFPWAFFFIIMQGILMHESIKFDYWYLAAISVNIVLYLWFVILKPKLEKSWKIED